MAYIIQTSTPQPTWFVPLYIYTINRIEKENPESVKILASCIFQLYEYNLKLFFLYERKKSNLSSILLSHEPFPMNIVIWYGSTGTLVPTLPNIAKKKKPLW